MGGGRLGIKNCGRWEIGGQKLWEVGDWGSKIVGGGRWAPLCHPLQEIVEHLYITVDLKFGMNFLHILNVLSL